MAQFTDTTETLTLPNPQYGYATPRDLGEAEARTAGGVRYCYAKGAVTTQHDRLTFKNMPEAKKDALLAFLERNRAGVTFTYVDYAGTSRQVVNLTPKPEPTHDAFRRWSVTLTLEVVG
jgi:hypothetical protein